MSAQPDERRGVPSASGMQRIVNCPASFRMEQASYAEPESKDASAGTLIHAVLAGLANYDDLTPEQQQTCDMCEGAMDRAFRDWAGGGAATLTQKEVRLGLTVDGRSIVVTPEETAEFVFTGQYDRLCIIGDRAIVMDTKTGRGDYEAAVDNDQLAALADLVHLHHKVNHVRVVLAQPWRKNGVTVADYTPNIWPIVHTWLIDSVHGAMNATPDQTKEGPWCKFCRAKLGCKTYNHRLNQNLEVVDPLRISGLAPKEQGQAMWAILMEVSPERLVAAVNGLPFHKRFIHAVESTFMARVEAGEIPGYQIEAKPGNREITDAQAAFNALQPLGITSDDVLAACKLPLGAMEEAARKASGIKSQTPGRTTYNLTAQQAKDSVNAALEAAGAIGRKAEGRQIVRAESAIKEK